MLIMKKRRQFTPQLDSIHNTPNYWQYRVQIAKCGVHAVIWFLHSEQATRNVVLGYCPSSWHCSAAYCSCNKEAPEEFSMESVWSPTIICLDLIPCNFHVFPHMKCCRRTTFWYNELQTNEEKWLKAQAAGFYDEGIGKSVPRYEKCVRRSVVYVEK